MFDEKLLSIDIGSKSIKLLEVRLGKKPAKLALKLVPTPLDSIREGEILDQAKLTESIKKALVEMKCKTKKTVICIDSPFVNVRELRLPVLKDEEIRSAAIFQLQQTFPGVSQTHSISFKLYEKNERGITGIVSFCPVKIIDGYTGLMKNLGLELKYIDVSANCAIKTYKRYVWDGAAKESVVLANIGYSSSQVNIVMNGKLLLSRNVSCGLSDMDRLYASRLEISEEQAQKDRIEGYGDKISEDDVNSYIRLGYSAIEEQIRQAIDFYSYNKYELAISKMYLMGGGSKFVGLEDYYSSAFRMRTEVIKPSKDNTYNQEEFLIYAHAIGASVREE